MVCRNKYSIIGVTLLAFLFLGLQVETVSAESKAKEPIVTQSSMPLLWSDAATWGGSKPVAGENVTIPNGVTIILDENTPALGGITIDGILEFDRQNLSLSAAWILIHGELRVGTEAMPFTQQATITLTGNDPEVNIMGMGTRGIMVMGGALELHGDAPDVLWTKINQHASGGSTALELMESADWNVGDEVVIGPTDYYRAANGASISQRVALTSVAGQNISIDAGLNAFRWGLLQYATPSGLSLSNSNIIPSPEPDTESTSTPKVLDERAPVGNLTRNIVLQAPNDDLWNNQDFGFHVMIMGTGATAHVDGVEFRRAGQAGRLQRYAFHWHMLSYVGTQTLDDATGQYIRNSTINSSKNRGIVIHGTNGVTVQNNIVFDIRGHGIFTEDAVERRNTIDGNLVLHVRNPAPGQELKQHETGERGSSGFWISNPDNTVINNHAADNGTNGFWLAFPQQPWGESIQVLHSDGLLLNPSRLLFGTFDNNTSHSNQKEGIMIDNVEVSNDGTTFPFQYQSTIDGREPSWPYPTRRRFALSRYKTWKNGSNGIWDRGVWADNFEVVSADNAGRFFAGSGADGIIERSLVIGTSLNTLMNGTDRPNFNDFQGNQTPAAFATYHSAFDIRNNIVINFPLVDNTRSGAFATEDYYIRPVDKGHVRNTNNVLINTHTGVKLPARFSYFALAGALWDPHNNWGGAGDNNYFVYDTPFFTHGQTPTTVQPGPGAGGVLVEGPFYGFNHFILNEGNLPWEDLMALSVTRFDESFNSVGSWNLDTAEPDWTFQHMRHFAAHSGGFYSLEFPDIETVSDIAVSVENMLTTSDSLILGVEFSGAHEVGQVYISSFSNFMSEPHTQAPTFSLKHVFEPVGSRQEVVNSPGGETYWHDVANNMVWMKIHGGIQQTWNDQDYSDTSDERLYRLFNLRIYSSGLSVSNEDEHSVPTAFALRQNYPNPFNPTTNIEFDVARTSNVSLDVYNIVGQKVATLVNGVQSAGTHTVQWNASTQASGIYFLRMQSESGILIRKMMLMK